jgi:hypothetical protein
MPRGGTQRRNLKEESLGFLEKTQTFEKSLLRDNNLVDFFFLSRLNDPDEQNRLPIKELSLRTVSINRLFLFG